MVEYCLGFDIIESAICLVIKWQ